MFYCGISVLAKLPSEACHVKLGAVTLPHAFGYHAPYILSLTKSVKYIIRHVFLVARNVAYCLFQARRVWPSHNAFLVVKSIH